MLQCIAGSFPETRDPNLPKLSLRCILEEFFFVFLGGFFHPPVPSLTWL